MSLAQEFGVRPTHIKIDVEGYDASVLRGGVAVLSSSPAPLLLIEWHNKLIRESGGGPADTLAILRNYGYQTRALDNNLIDEVCILSKPLIRIIAKESDPKN